MMEKLIVFGCSFTNYCWPTWADVIAIDNPSWQFENWALPGGGNQMIARRVLYKHYWQGFQPNDMVCIQWSSWLREDRFQQKTWHNKGSVFQSSHYGLEWAQKYWDFDNDIINNAQAQLTTQAILGSKLAYQMQLDDPIKNYRQVMVTDHSLFSFWRPQLGLVDSVINTGKFLDGYTNDAHPDPAYWLSFVEQRIYPKLRLNLNPSTKKRILDFQHWLVDQAKNTKDHNEIMLASAERMKQEGMGLNLMPPGSRHPYTNELILM